MLVQIGAELLGIIGVVTYYTGSPIEVLIYLPLALGMSDRDLARCSAPGSFLISVLNSLSAWYL